MKMENSFKVDLFLELDKDFWHYLETECVAECCGIDAFDFSEDSIKEALKFYNRTKVKKNLDALIKKLASSNRTKVSSYLLNASMSKEEFIDNIKRIKKIISKYD